MECPHCKSKVTITGVDKTEEVVELMKVYKPERYRDHHVARITLGRCPNHECGELMIWVLLCNGGQWIEGERNYIDIVNRNVVFSELVYPKIETDLPEIPEYVPVQIKNDIIEAVKIKALSPKASATLIRRAIQGMIRDFHKIKEKTLFLEIEKLKGEIEDESWESINAIRSIGNIGAHMEGDVNLIIDIDLDEADLLISLALDFVNDWYKVRHERQQRSIRLVELAAQKKDQRKSLP